MFYEDSKKCLEEKSKEHFEFVILPAVIGAGFILTILWTGWRVRRKYHLKKIP